MYHGLRLEIWLKCHQFVHNSQFLLSNKTMKFSPSNRRRRKYRNCTTLYSLKSQWFNNEQQKICMAPFNYPITHLNNMVISFHLFFISVCLWLYIVLCRWKKHIVFGIQKKGTNKKPCHNDQWMTSYSVCRLHIHLVQFLCICLFVFTRKIIYRSCVERTSI